MVIDHLSKNKKSSLISIKSSRKALYREYLKLIEDLEFTFLTFKNKISVQRFNKQFKRLTNKEKGEIEKEYAFEVYAKEPK